MAVLAFALTACQQAPPPLPDTHDADIKAITDIEVEANKSYGVKDQAKLVAFYANDAVLMSPGAPPASGLDAIRAELTQMLADPALSLSFQAKRVDVSKSGELAYTQGSYQMAMTDPQTHQIVKDHGSYVTIYRKQPDGSWKAEVDIATSEVPLSPPPAVKKH
jgi:uncharacterized protein (TIGR02246 family)